MEKWAYSLTPVTGLHHAKEGTFQIERKLGECIGVFWNGDFKHNCEKGML